MIWVSTQTRPDIAFNVGWISNKRKFTKGKLLFETNKALQKLKSKTGSLTFPQLGKSSNLNTVCYTDATYASLEDGSSRGGFIIFVCGMMN